MVFNSPPARSYTNYSASCVINQRLMSENKVSGSEYRHFLQKNAEKIMNQNRHDIATKIRF
jgi:hypothetical protein